MLQTHRREFVRALLTGAAGLTLTWRPAGAQGRGPAPITATKITDRIVVLSGNGGNEGIVIGPDGLVMIDGGLAPRAADLAKAIAEISPRLVQVLFNTHYHFDHVGSNEHLGAQKVRIIAHENVKKRLGATFENPAMGRTMEALPAVALPTETFSTGGRLQFGPEAIHYTHAPTAHTDGDAFVFFANSNAIHTGDLYWVGRYPVVDYSVGGSLARMAAVLEQMDKVGDADTKIISGHGNPNSTKKEMRQIRNVWLEINSRLEAFAKQGRTVEELIAAAPTKEFDGQFGNSMGFLRQAYGGVLAQQQNAR
jgi:cyclase